MGDVLYGLILWLAGGVASGILLIATGDVDGSTGSIGELSIGMLAVTLAAGWVGFVGWPIVATYRKGQRSLAKDFGLEVRWIDVGWGILGGAVALAASVAAGVIWKAVSNEDSPSNADFLPSDPNFLTGLALFVLVAVCTPIAEELFFRGLFLRAVGRRWGLPTAIVVTSLVFGLFHVQGDSLGQGAFIVGVTAAYGAVFALLVVRASGRLGPSIIAHATVNGVGVLAALFLT